MELIGKVTKIGRIKDYGMDTNFGKTHVEITKFFLSIETTDQGVVNAMVECNAQESEYGYRISKDEARQKPFIGDTVKFTTRSLRTGNDGTKWASITFNQTFEITEQNMDARKEREEFIAAKKQERLDVFTKQKEDQTKARAEAKEARKQALEALKHDERLPESVRAEVTASFDLTRIISLLRDTTWFTMPEGEGGHRCEHNGPVACGCQHPGTGMRRRNGPLYDTPASIRASILSKGTKTGLIIETERGFKATPTGVKLLKTLDTCPVCSELREPYDSTSHYSNGHSSIIGHGITYICKHEMAEMEKKVNCSNWGVAYTPVKNIDHKRERIALTIQTMSDHTEKLPFPKPKYIPSIMQAIKDAPFPTCSCGYNEPVKCTCGYGLIHFYDFGQFSDVNLGKVCDTCGGQYTTYGYHLLHTILAQKEV